ncbi:MAG: hypothetical protein CSA81_13660 [Acidobacteria bacterium]|nr:MAG: hypothetical protein CSA81_13660 [Acidobacteriota bacterium]
MAERFLGERTFCAVVCDCCVLQRRGIFVVVAVVITRFAESAFLWHTMAQRTKKNVNDVTWF